MGCCWASRIWWRVLGRRERGPRVDWVLLKVHAVPMARQRSHGGVSVHLTLRILHASHDLDPIFLLGRLGAEGGGGLILGEDMMVDDRQLQATWNWWWWW